MTVLTVRLTWLQSYFTNRGGARAWYARKGALNTLRLPWLAAESLH